MNHLFSGLKIIDVTRVFSWPFATRYFCDYWAEVIKIETLNNYDESRNFWPMVGKTSAYFEMLNRWKKSISLDLKDEKQRNIFYELIKEADVFVENFSPNIKTKLQIDYQTLSHINPKLIYASLNGYGEENNKKAYDVIIQAESWLASLNGKNYPMKNATSIIDTLSGVSLSLAISSLLYKREKTGLWDYVNVSMMACAMQLLEQNLTETSLTKQNPDFVWNQDSAIFPFWFFHTKDGEISLAIWNDILWEKFCEVFLPNCIGKYLWNIQRLHHKILLTSIIETAFQQYNGNEISKKLDEIGIPNSKIYLMKDILDNSELYQNNAIKKHIHPILWECVFPYEFTKYHSYQINEIKNAPCIGEHNKDFNIL